jgi:hypothetical protein
MSAKGLTQKAIDEIVAFLEEQGWQEQFEPKNPSLYKKFKLENNNVRIYTSKDGYTVSCNTEVLLQQLLDRKFERPRFTTYRVEIDDAGTGSPVGGIIIGYRFHYPEGNKILQKMYDIHKFNTIPVNYFQSPLYETKKYLEFITEKILQELQTRNVDKTWLIQVCSGYVFSHARKTLIEKGFNVTIAKIEGELQKQVEEKFREHLMTCHIPEYLIRNVPNSKNDHRNFFNRLIKYIRQHPLLLSYCKTGWPYFKKKFANYFKTFKEAKANVQ